MAAPGAPNGTGTARYGGVARFFHWTVAGLIVLQYLLAELGEMAEDGGERVRQLALLANHKSVGMTVLALAVLRVGWRLLQSPPALPTSMPGWQRIASHISHWSLYALIFALPVTGWLMSSASAYSVSWFGLFTWPDLVEPSKALRGVMHDAHEILGKLLLVIAIVHVAAALKHHFLDRDDVLRRISSLTSWLLFVAVIGAGGWMLFRTGGTADVPRAAASASTEEASAEAAAEGDAPAGDTQADDATSDAAAAADAEAVGGGERDTGSDDVAGSDAAGDPASAPESGPAEDARSDATGDADAAASQPPDAASDEPAVVPDWVVDYDASHIEFTAEQAGADFTGRWTDWSADMRFAGDALGSSAFDVQVRVSGVETNDDDRDSTLKDPEFFDAADHPVVRYESGPFRADGDGFATDGTLTVKGQPHPVTLNFKVERDGERRVLTGNARLDRLALGVGTGEWADTEWIGQYVDVDVRVEARIRAD